MDTDILQKKLISTRIIAERWGVSRSTVTRLLEGKVTKVLLGDCDHGAVRYVESEVEDYIRERLVQPREDRRELLRDRRQHGIHLGTE